MELFIKFKRDMVKFKPFYMTLAALAPNAPLGRDPDVKYQKKL